MVHNVLGQRFLGFLRNDPGQQFTYTSLHSYTHVNQSSPQDDLRRLTLRLASRVSGLKATEEAAVLVNAHPPGGHHHLHNDSVRLHVDS